MGTTESREGCGLFYNRYRCMLTLNSFCSERKATMAYNL